MSPLPPSLIPAKAGIQCFKERPLLASLGPRFRGDERRIVSE
jgi:hypothetical protein